LTTYTAAAPGLLPDRLLVQINDRVGRFTSTPAAEHYLAKYYQPTGQLTVPTVTLHTVRDPLVPFGLHEPPFAATVAGAGRSPLLLQRSVNAFGHCAFSTDQMVDGFGALARWVETGVKPAG
jgi:hypothetical protein